MANYAQLVNVIAPIMTNTEGLFLQPIYFPIAEFGRQRGNTSLDVWVSSPTYRIGNRRQDIPYLDVSSTVNVDGRALEDDERRGDVQLSGALADHLEAVSRRHVTWAIRALIRSFDRRQSAHGILSGK